MKRKICIVLTSLLLCVAILPSLSIEADSQVTADDVRRNMKTAQESAQSLSALIGSDLASQLEDVFKNFSNNLDNGKANVSILQNALSTLTSKEDEIVSRQTSNLKALQNKNASDFIKARLDKAETMQKTWNTFETSYLKERMDKTLKEYSSSNGDDYINNSIKNLSEYADALNANAQSYDALLKLIYLTHAFEYETSQDIKNILDIITVKTAAYAVATQNALSLSSLKSDDKKQQVLQALVSCLKGLQRAKETALANDPAYCYVTNSIIDLGSLKLSGTVQGYYKTKDNIKTYRSSYASNITPTLRASDGSNASENNLLGIDRLEAIADMLSMTNQSLNTDFIASRLVKKQSTVNPNVVISLGKLKEMQQNSNIKLKALNIMGNYFGGNPVFYMNNLPGYAEHGYIAQRNMLPANVYNPVTGKISVDMPVFAIGVYGENHNMWYQDEFAFFGGPTDKTVLNQETSVTKTDTDSSGNVYYTQRMDQSAEYNCLLSILSGKTSATGSLKSFAEYVKDNKEETKNFDWENGRPAKNDDGTAITLYEQGNYQYSVLANENDLVDITFAPNGGMFYGSKVPVTRQFTKGKEIMLPGDPEREGYNFLGWDEDLKAADSKHKVSDAATFTAQWEKMKEKTKKDPKAQASQNSQVNPDQQTLPSDTPQQTTPSQWSAPPTGID